MIFIDIRRLDQRSNLAAEITPSLVKGLDRFQELIRKAILENITACARLHSILHI